MNSDDKEKLGMNQKSYIESILDAMGVTDEEEREKKIKEHEDGVSKAREHIEEHFRFLRPFINKLQIFTDNDLFQYIKKENNNPEWVNFKNVKFYVNLLLMESKIEYHVIYQEKPRPNTFIYYISEISEGDKQFYIDCIEECNKLKTNCNEKLFQKKLN